MKKTLNIFGCFLYQWTRFSLLRTESFMETLTTDWFTGRLWSLFLQFSELTAVNARSPKAGVRFKPEQTEFEVRFCPQRAAIWKLLLLSVDKMGLQTRATLIFSFFFHKFSCVFSFFEVSYEQKNVSAQFGCRFESKPWPKVGKPKPHTRFSTSKSVDTLRFSKQRF